MTDEPLALGTIAALYRNQSEGNTRPHWIACSVCGATGYVGSDPLCEHMLPLFAPKEGA